MIGIPPYTTAEITTGDAIRAILYVAAVASIVLGIIAWSLAPIVRDIRQRRAMRRRMAVARSGKRRGRVLPDARDVPEDQRPL